MPDIEKNYHKVLEQYLKEKFIKSFSDVLNEKTDYMIEIFFEEKNELIERLDKLFSSREDKDLNAVNKHINNTLESIRTYINFLNTFTVSENAKSFFENYPNNTLLPIFQTFNKDLNERMKEIIMTEINNNSKTIESLNYTTFTEKVDDIYNKLIFGSIFYIHNEIYQYCQNEQSYENKLNERKMIDTSDESEKAAETRMRLESKYVEESLELLVNKTRNTKNYINTLPALNNIEKRIKNFETTLNIDYKAVKDKIIQNKYNDEINVFLNRKLLNLTNILYNYYNEINSSFFILRKDLIDSIYNINDSLIFSVDITRFVLNREYQKISNGTERIKKIRKNYVEVLSDPFKHGHISENTMNNATGYINDISEYAEFELDLILEGNNFKIPRVKARINNRIIPKDLEVTISSGIGNCIERNYDFIIELNDVNYTMTIDYDIKSSYINITTYINIENYHYSIMQSDLKGEVANEEVRVFKYLRGLNCTNLKNNINYDDYFEESAVQFNDSIIIPK